MVMLVVAMQGCGYDKAPEVHPNLYLNAAEIAEIKGKLGLSPWDQAYADVMSNAERALAPAPEPVDGEYPSDKSSPRAHYKAADRDGNRAVFLGLAYQFSGDLKYAKKARDYVMAWVDAMEPEINSYQAGIELSITMPSLFWAADLIWGSGALSAGDIDDLQEWARDLGYSAIEAETFCCGRLHNIHNWEWSLQAAAGVISGDVALFQQAVEKYKSVVGERYESNLLLKSEGARTFEYAWFGLKAMTMLAEVARHQGIDLYNYESAGFSLYKASRAHVDWFLQRNYPGVEANYDLVIAEELELAEIWYSIWGDKEFKQAALIKGRPSNDVFVLGPVTFTHGERKLKVAALSAK
jgi:hypothetical protein